MNRESPTPADVASSVSELPKPSHNRRQRRYRQSGGYQRPETGPLNEILRTNGLAETRHNRRKLMKALTKEKVRREREALN